MSSGESFGLSKRGERKGDSHVLVQLSRRPRPSPRILLNPRITSIFDFRYEDFVLEAYDPHPHIRAPISV